ncbi:Stealth CR1 domain-containing protein [Acinetobacter sp. BY484]|uniref:Stealth CR1 domain-containing protein n=1 Tax=Acinetobacter sp. BY484 TaxID=2820674 RepID=UPI001C230C4A|nr:Stealth CR1 domain-containing protein [Acinetobacter sp. BY484]
MKKIDFVIAWVDGGDPKHQAKRQQFQSKVSVKGAAEDTRFASNDEIYFCIASILKYVPYLGTIYIVTDDQKPTYLDEFIAQGLCHSDQIQVVDHTTIFKGYEQYLPTFNSLSIETMLWNIPNLSQHFIYLNDDFFFNAPSELADFLTDQQTKIYGHWVSNAFIQLKFNWRKGVNRYFGKPLQPKYTIAQMLSAVLCGFDRYYEIHHRPHLLDQMTLKAYFEKNPKVLAEQIQYRFRSALQFLPIGLNNHLKIQHHQAILCEDIEIAYLKNEASITQFLLSLQQKSIKFGCIQSLDQLSSVQQQHILSALKLKFKDYLPQSLSC